MTFAIGCDHAGFELKQEILSLLEGLNIQVVDYGTDGNKSVDYPDYGAKVSQAVSSGKVDRGILICGTGIGMSIVANKFPGVRAALAADEFMAQMAKEHNNANILVLGGRVLTAEQAVKMVSVWLDAHYEGGRHQRRLDKITQLEAAFRAGKL